VSLLECEALRILALGATAASVQLASSLGSAFGAAIAGAVLFIVLSMTDPTAATLFFEMIRYGPSVRSSEQQKVVRAAIATAFRGVFAFSSRLRASPAPSLQRRRRCRCADMKGEGAFAVIITRGTNLAMLLLFLTQQRWPPRPWRAAQ
jgi:hypothetical protein